MDIGERLKKGKFWSSGNAHVVFMGQAGCGVKESKATFAGVLASMLRRHKSRLVEVKPAVLIIGYKTQNYGGLGYRPLSNAVKAVLRPTTVEAWGYGKMKLWWD